MGGYGHSRPLQYLYLEFSVRGLLDTSLVGIDAGGLQATSGVGPAAAAARPNSVPTGVPPADFKCFFFF